MTRIARKTISAIDMTFTGINSDKPPSVHSRSQIDKPTKDTIESLEVRPPPPSKWQISRGTSTHCKQSPTLDLLSLFSLATT